MNSLRILDRRAGYLVAAFALLLATFIPALAFAAQVTERSIELSSTTAGASNVTYNVKFTPRSDAVATAYVIDFCSNSPTVGMDCTAPTGFDATSASNYTTGTADDANTVVRTGTFAKDTEFAVTLTGITNPSTADPLYARIITFDTSANAGDYVSNPVEPAVNDGAIDDGGVAMSINPTISVSGAVQESMTFCISAAAITASCASTTPPTLELGETVGNAKALSSEAVSTGTINTQISTNAIGGAVISLKSGTPCGGMKRAAATGCDIAPALTSGIANGEAKFGVRTATATATADYTEATGVLRPYDEGGAGASYNNTTYTLNYLANNSTGVTSTYGDPFLDTNNAPVNNMNMALTFGASVNENTPAGTYSTSLSMIATGKF